MVDADIARAQVCAKGNGVISKSPDTEVGVPLSNGQNKLEPSLTRRVGRA
jgi:hypothetical protein